MSPPFTRRRAGPLETAWVEVPEAALEPFEAAFEAHCDAVGMFLADEDARIWRVEGVRDRDEDIGPLSRAVMLAGFAGGYDAPLNREAVEAEGWVLRTQEAFPELLVGRRFAVRGTHDRSAAAAGRITLVLDAGLAFGSGEHGSTRGCLRALERVARTLPARPRALDLGTGSGILAMAAARLLRVPVLATDIEPWSVRVAGQNAVANGAGRLVRPVLADGWRSVRVRRAAPFDLVFANILARPLCRMAGGLAAHLAPGGTAILAGLLDSQARLVLAAHRRQGLVLVDRLCEGQWTTLVIRKPVRLGPVA